MNVYVARQPIFDRKKRIYAYELLFRDGTANAFPEINGEVATSRLLTGSFWNIGLDRLTRGRLAFINFTAELLCRHVPTLFPAERLVVEILEDVAPVPMVVEACHKLVAAGYTLALDDFRVKPDLAPLIRLARIIKIDFRELPPASSRRLIEALDPMGKVFLGEKVETHEEFEEACQLGYRYFQGYFFARPEVLQYHDIPTDKLNWMRIMAEVNQPDFSMEKIERFLVNDVSITYKLLRYINSAYFARPEPITSIRQALLLLGQREVRRFVSLIATANLATGKPDELMRTVIVRARLCELLGRATGAYRDGAELFILGMFSLIDAMLDRPMAGIMHSLPLSEQIKKALVDQEGELADYLELVKAYETMDWPAIVRLSSRLAMAPDKLPALYFDALGWAGSYDQAGVSAEAA